MRAGVASFLLAIILVLTFCWPALAADSRSITITMIGVVDEISITLDKTQWPLGEVASDTEYKTSPPIEWCTLNVTGNCAVETFIVGEDAKWDCGDTMT
jgi:hypothetical protein